MNQTNSKIRTGMTILVTMKTIKDKHGRTKYVNARPVRQTIDTVFPDGTVRTSSGDIWKVGRNSEGVIAIANM